jgi:hypothetical protein
MVDGEKKGRYGIAPTIARIKFPEFSPAGTHKICMSLLL